MPIRKNKHPYKKDSADKHLTITERINKTLEIPSDILPNSSLVTIRSRSSVTVEGCTSILLYTPNEIRLSMKKGDVCIMGEELVCTSYHSVEVTVEGKINSVSFEEGE